MECGDTRDNHDICRNYVSLLIGMGFSAVDIAGRMSLEERAELEQRIMASGKSKQDYMIQNRLEHKIEVIANRKMLMNIQNRTAVIEAERKRIIFADALDMEKFVAFLRNWDISYIEEMFATC